MYDSAALHLKPPQVVEFVFGSYSLIRHQRQQDAHGILDILWSKLYSIAL